MRKMLLLLLLLVGLSLTSLAAATEYHVGAGQQYATMNDLLSAVTLGDNDIVWVHPGTYSNFWVKAGGGSSRDAAVQIRAWDPNNKPVFDAAGADNCVQFEDPDGLGMVGKWFLIDSLEVTGAASRGIYNVSCNIVVQNCYVHDNHNGYMGGWHNCRDDERGDAIFEGNEFYRNGSGNYAHQLYMEGYIAEFRYNWVHENTGGLSYKDRSRDSTVEYNYIEQGPNGVYTVEFCGFDDKDMPDIPQYAKMIGNVVLKNGGGNHWLFIGNERSEGGQHKYDNIGYLTLVNNTFYTQDHTGPMLGTDDGSIVTAHNNIFHSTTCDRIIDKVDIAKSPGTVETSYNNWVDSRMTVPAEFTGTVFGTDPGLVDCSWPLGDFHLTASSPCINAGRNDVSDLPTKEYSHPCGWVDRYSDGAIDIGAYEYYGAPVAPTADFSGNPTSGYVPLTVDFTDLSTGNPTSWSWDFGDTGSSTAQNPSHEYASTGSYTVSLTATNAQGSDTEIKPDYISVSEQPQTSCHVGSIDLVGHHKTTGKPSDRGYYAEATITVHDQDCNVLAGVTVVFTSPVNADGGTFTCTVDNLTKSGYPYDSASNHETSDSIQNP